MEQFLINPNPKIKIIRRKLPKQEIEKEKEIEKPEYSDSMKEYIEQLDETGKKAFDIAKSHLGSSFNPYLSNGYLKWTSSLK
jgi:hypothetical protein